MIFPGVNEGADPMDIVGSHQRLLIAAALRTRGPMLELGCGWYSTPLLHEVARAFKDRPLFTVDNNADWLSQYKKLETPGVHQLKLVGWWGETWEYLKDVPKFGLCFVDQGQPIEREYAIRTLLSSSPQRVDVFVCHDTEEGFAYGYSRTLKMFKYQYTDKCQRAWTTICSNTVDVTKWGIRDLPMVEPTKDVT